MATLTLHPNEVDTALGDRLSPEKSLVKELHRLILGLSSATTTHVRMHERSTPRDLSDGTDPPKPLVHSSMTPGARNTDRDQDCDVQDLIARLTRVPPTV